MDSWSEFLQFCLDDKDFEKFLDAFNEYVDGDCGAADVLSENFLMNGTIPNGTPRGKYMTCREKDKSTGDGKYRAFSVSERIANLKEVVSP
jgi:hypothetical protein